MARSRANPKPVWISRLASRVRERLPQFRLSLTWRFAVAALVTIALVGYVLTRLLGQVITDNALENTRAEARDALARRILHHLSPEDLAAPMTGERLAHFQRFVEESIISERTARIKIWNTEGRVIYSDDPGQIGRLFPIDDERKAAFAGETVSELSHPSEAEASSEAEYGDLLEVYTPIVFPGSQEVVGAFEIYQVYDPVAQQIAATQRYVVYGLGGGLAVLYLALVGIVHGGTRVIGRQHRELENEVIERRRANEALRQAHIDTVMMLAAAAEAHDQATGLHLRSVRAVTESLARELGYGEQEARELGLAAVLHDIGKIRVRDSILASSGWLTKKEWQAMKHHTTWGEEFLTGRPGFELAAAIARSHHERWDGTGYPDGLVGEAIPEAAAIVAVADSLDAMTSNRAYRTILSLDEAFAVIVACSGTQLSPKVIAALARLYKRDALPRKPVPASEREAAA